jgi:hypothetical protein
VGSHRRSRLLANQGENGLVIEIVIIESIQEVHGPRSRCSDAYTDLAGELRGCTGHEACHLLMPHLNGFDVTLGSRMRTDQAADSITRVAEYTAYAPGLQAPPDEVTQGFRHRTHTKIGMPCSSSVTVRGHIGSAERNLMIRVPFCSQTQRRSFVKCLSLATS